jgi:hypothetical protein
VSRQPIDDLADVLSDLRRGRAGLPSKRLWDRMLSPPGRVRPMGLVAMQMSINPFEFFFLIAIVLTSFAYVVLRAPAPNSVQTLLPQFAVIVWWANLGTGSCLALFGGLWRSKLDTGLAMYQLGWFLTGLACFVYSLAILILHPVLGLFPAMTNMAFTIACVVRVIQVQRFFRLTRQLIRAQFPVAAPTEVATGADESPRGQQ